MIDVIIGSIRKTAESWKAEAGRRRKISGSDPVADTLDYCAGEIGVQLGELEAASAWLTAEQYARIKLVTPQTVRNWIRRGELEAIDTPKGYQIRRSARRVKGRRPPEEPA